MTNTYYDYTITTNYDVKVLDCTYNTLAKRYLNSEQTLLARLSIEIFAPLFPFMNFYVEVLINEVSLETLDQDFLISYTLPGTCNNP